MLTRGITIGPALIGSARLDRALKMNVTAPGITPNSTCNNTLDSTLGSMPGNDLPATITQASSKQTYYTIRLLADRARVTDAYRAYAYFRWVDDRLDTQAQDTAAHTAFVLRQQALIDASYRGQSPGDLTEEEAMLLDLIQGDRAPESDLQSYIRNMMAVMAFDAGRRGQVITGQELATYTRHLATAVTDALYHFIGHDDAVPRDRRCYLAVAAAHITHMLRDTCEDIAAGYFNIPREFLAAHGIGPADVETPAYRAWVRSRVKLARAYFAAGKACITGTGNLRRRLAGHAYVARFEAVLDAIEREAYHLRPAYPELKRLGAGLRLGRSVLGQMVAG
ncbi:MAG: squalene/phytoene synthase family protein [Anaerolineae bacterium]|nr:squalene/phytoene synthase family protein [Anaerolineae bacterium]